VTDSGQATAKGPCLRIAPLCHGDDDATTALQPTAMMQVLAGGFGAPEWGVRALGALRHSVDTIIIAARGAGTTSHGRRGATAAEPAATVWCGACWRSPTARRCCARTQTRQARTALSVRSDRFVWWPWPVQASYKVFGGSSRATTGPTATHSCKAMWTLQFERAAAINAQQRPCGANGAAAGRRSGRYRTG